LGDFLDAIASVARAAFFAAVKAYPTSRRAEL
jgi:hypothetical protein